jgi:hypothetical protein
MSRLLRCFRPQMNKTVSGTTTQFLYEGLNPVQELNGSNGVGPIC